MNKINIATSFATLALFASCSAPKGMSVQQYASMTRPTSASTAPILFRMSAKEPMKAPIQYASHELSIGRTFQVAAQRDFVYPSAYQPGKVSLPNVTPATPTEFKTVKTGLVADLTTKRLGELILIQGSVTVTEFQGFSRMGGAIGLPILDSKDRLITENRIEMPMLATYTTPVYVAIKPGSSSTCDLSSSKKGTKITFSLDRKN